MDYCYHNGNIMPTSEAVIPLKDISVLRGYGVYEALTVFGDKPFELQAHMDRLRSATNFMRVTVPLTDERIADVISDLVSRSGYARTNIKFIASGGQTVDGIDFDPQGEPTFYIFSEECKPLPTECYTTGVSVITCEHLREFAQYKTTNYAKGVMQKQLQKQAGTMETLYVWQGTVLECATSNFAIVKDGTLITSKDNILHGITRLVTLRLAREAGIRVEEREVSVAEMLTADECLLTSSFKDIVPVVRVDSAVIGTGQVGPVTQRLIGLFREYALK